jgi:hypothetical protein
LKPSIAIELKWAESSIGKKDRRSLNLALKKLGVQKAYWMSAVISPKKREIATKNEVEKSCPHHIVIPMVIEGKALTKWKTKRKIFRSDMPFGTSRKLGPK